MGRSGDGFVRAALVWGCVVLITGCTAIGPVQEPAPVEGPGGPGIVVPPAPAGVAGGRRRAVLALLDEAQQELRAERHDRAAAALERALALEPGDPQLWHRMAVVRVRQRHWPQAEALAAKSNSLAAYPALRAANWRIIAQARRARGDRQGARAATHQARRLEGVETR